MKFDAKVTISRSSGGDDPGRPMSITIEDATSGCELVEVRMSLEEFAAAITGYAMRPAAGDYYQHCPVGKRREIKHEDIGVPRGWTFSNRDAAAKLIMPFEVDGWNGYADDLLNHHRHVSANKYRVLFTRFVDAPPDVGAPESAGRR